MENEENNASFDWADLEQKAQIIDGKDSLPQQSEIQTEEAQGITSADLMQQTIQVLSDVFAPNWGIQHEESEQLGAIYGALIDKYLPETNVDKFGLEISAVLVTGMILKTRLGVPLRELPKKATVTAIGGKDE